MVFKLLEEPERGEKKSQTSSLDHSGTFAFNDSALKLSECFPYKEHKIVFRSVCRQIRPETQWLCLIC